MIKFFQAQARDEKMAKQQQREKLQLEIAARERAEKKQQEYEERLRNMAEEMDRRQTELNEAQEMIRRLEEQLKQLQAAKEELENRQKVSLFNHDLKKNSLHYQGTINIFTSSNLYNSDSCICHIIMHDFFFVICVYACDVGIDSDDGEVGTLARDGGCGAR